MADEAGGGAAGAGPSESPRSPRRQSLNLPAALPTLFTWPPLASPADTPSQPQSVPPTPAPPSSSPSKPLPIPPLPPDQAPIPSPGSIQQRPKKSPKPADKWVEREASWLSESTLFEPSRPPRRQSEDDPLVRRPRQLHPYSPSRRRPSASSSSRPPPSASAKQPHRLGEFYDRFQSTIEGRLEELAARTLQHAFRRRAQRRERAYSHILQRAAAKRVQRCVRVFLERERRQNGVVDLRLSIFTVALQKSMVEARRRRRRGGVSTPHAMTPTAKSPAARTPVEGARSGGERGGGFGGSSIGRERTPSVSVRFSSPVGALHTPMRTSRASRVSFETPFSTGAGGRTPRPLLETMQVQIEERLRGILTGWREPERVYGFATWRASVRYGHTMRARTADGRIALRRAQLSMSWRQLRRLLAVRHFYAAVASQLTCTASRYAVWRWRARLLDCTRWWAHGASRAHASLTHRRRIARAWLVWRRRTLASVSGYRTAIYAIRVACRRRARLGLGRWRLAAHIAAAAAEEAAERRRMAWRRWRCSSLHALTSRWQERLPATRERRAIEGDLLRASTTTWMRAYGARVLRAIHAYGLRREACRPKRENLHALVSRWRCAGALHAWRHVHGRLSARAAGRRVGALCHRLHVACRLLSCLRTAGVARAAAARHRHLAQWHMRRRLFIHLRNASRTHGASGRTSRCARAYYAWRGQRSGFDGLWRYRNRRCRARALHVTANTWVTSQANQRLLAALRDSACAAARRRAASSSSALALWRHARVLWPRWGDVWTRCERERRRGIALGCRRIHQHTLSRWREWAVSHRLDCAMEALVCAASSRRRRKLAFESWVAYRNARAARPSLRVQRRLARRQRTAGRSHPLDPPQRAAMLRSWRRWARRSGAQHGHAIDALVALVRGRALRRARKVWRRHDANMTRVRAALDLAASHSNGRLFHKWSRRHVDTCARAERALSAPYAVALRRLRTHAAAHAAAARFNAAACALADAHYRHGALARWLMHLEHDATVVGRWRAALMAQGRPLLSRWRRAVARCAIATAYVHAGLAAIARHRTRHVLVAWCTEIASAARALALLRRGVHAYASGRVRQRAVPRAMHVWRVLAARRRAVCAMASAIVLGGALARWRHARMHAWGRRELHEIGEAAANMLAAQRTLGAWRQGAAKHAERREAREQVRAQVEQVHAAAASAAALAAARTLIVDVAAARDRRTLPPMAMRTVGRCLR